MGFIAKILTIKKGIIYLPTIREPSDCYCRINLSYSVIVYIVRYYAIYF